MASAKVDKTYVRKFVNWSSAAAV